MSYHSEMKQQSGNKTSYNNKNKKYKNNNKGYPNPLPSSRLPSDGKTWSILSGPKPASRLPQRVNNVPYRIVQTYDAGSLLTTSTTTPTFASANFQLNNVDQVTSFQNLFDQYRIDFIELWITPQFASNDTLSEYSSVIDFDDSGLLTSYAQASDFSNVVESSLSQGHYRRFKPHVAEAAYSGAFSSFANAVSPWLDCASPSVQHYGLKTAFKATAVASSVNMVVRYHISFRNIR